MLILEFSTHNFCHLQGIVKIATLENNECQV